MPRRRAHLAKRGAAGDTAALLRKGQQELAAVVAEAWPAVKADVKRLAAMADRDEDARRYLLDVATRATEAAVRIQEVATLASEVAGDGAIHIHVPDYEDEGEAAVIDIQDGRARAT